MRVKRTLLAAVTLTLMTSAGAQNEQQAYNQAENGEGLQQNGSNGLDQGAQNAGSQNAGNQNAGSQDADSQQNAGNQGNNAQGGGNYGNDNSAQGQENYGQENYGQGSNSQGNLSQGNYGQGNYGQGSSGQGGANSVPLNQAPLNQVPLNNGSGNGAPPINNVPINGAPVNNLPANNAPPANGVPHTEATGGAPPAAAAPTGPGGPAEMRFQFDQRGTPSLHSFILRWTDRNTSLSSIEVLISDTQEVIQTIAVPQDGTVNLVYNRISDKPGRIKDKFFDFIDYNFDNFGDIRLTRQLPYKVGDKSYLVWLFDEPSNQYILHPGISALSGPVPDPKTKRIESVKLGAWGGAEYEKRWYSLTSAGQLKVQTVVKQTIRDRSRLTFDRDVRQRINGEMQRICKLVVPAEGAIQRLWGTRERCDSYMYKQPL